MNLHIISISDVIISTNVVLRGKKTEVISIKYILDYVLVLYENEIKSSGIEIINEIDDIYIKGRKNQLVAIFMNIINNSLYWVTTTNSKPIIKIFSIDVDDNKIQIVFSDNGPGFQDPPEVLTSPFFTRKPNGMGLGLYLANILIKRLNGLLIFNFSKNKEELLDGASIGLEFRREKTNG